MAHVQYTDSLVKEYLVWRGFSSSLKSFDNELRNDKDRAFRADKTIEEISNLVNSYDLQGLKDLWTHLETNLFSKLDHSFLSPVKKLENSLFKYYLITAHSNNKTEKINEFFQKHATEIHSQSEWKDWFYLPFCKNPEDHSIFSVYFTKQWQETFLLSLHNFLATIYQCNSQPTIGKLENEMILIKKLQDENCALRNKLSELSQFQQMQSSLTSTSTLTGSGTSSGNSNPIGNGAGSTQVNSASGTGVTNNNNNAPSHTESSNKHASRSSGKSSATTYSTATAGNSGGGISQSLNEIISIDISPPGHIIDDFYIIATENASVNQLTDYQAKGLKSLIKNISSGTSPVMGRKDSLGDRSKRRSESVGRNWI